MLATLDRALDRVEAGFLGVAMIALFAMMLMVFTDVVLRYVFNSPLDGSLELSEEVFMIAVVFLPLGYTMAADSHVRVTFFTAKLPPAWRQIIGRLMLFVAFGFVALVARQGFVQAQFSGDLGATSRSLLAYPLWPSYVMLGVGAGTLALRMLLMALRGLPADRH